MRLGMQASKATLLLLDGSVVYIQHLQDWLLGLLLFVIPYVCCKQKTWNFYTRRLADEHLNHAVCFLCHMRHNSLDGSTVCVCVCVPGVVETSILRIRRKQTANILFLRHNDVVSARKFDCPS